MSNVQNVPFVSSPMSVDARWIAHNGHLNMAYYHVLLDRAFEEFGVVLGLGSLYIKATQCSLFAAEAHIRYLRELRANDVVRTTIILLAADDKRLHTVRQLHHVQYGWIAAMSENMTLHVDLAARKVVSFPDNIQDRLSLILKRHEAVDRPDGIGRRVSLQKQ
ncbi:thioesterase family protein [Bradyrhizobium sp. 180]|uniref:thioesterase family protein n=1 Tax=Bradyrhizobium sp. 180 TaxID=2782650 RepID=UPI001FF7CA97|nr:thioesterase family protein [Bradyrhizobium sp. 180]MCK1489122.1 thioesterase family protein [Bradyrhizobium sp. 180]